MRAILVSSILALTLMAPVAANAQAGSWKFSAGGGLTAPMGNSSDQNKSGGHGVVTFGYSPYHSSHTWAAEVDFHQMDRISPPSDGVTNGHANVLVFMGRYDHSISNGLYLTGGLGMVRYEFPYRVGTVALTNTDSRVGLALGAGVTLMQRVFLEGRLLYSIQSPVAKTLVPITLGVRF